MTAGTFNCHYCQTDSRQTNYLFTDRINKATKSADKQINT